MLLPGKGDACPLCLCPAFHRAAGADPGVPVVTGSSDEQGRPGSCCRAGAAPSQSPGLGCREELEQSECAEMVKTPRDGER